MFFLFELPSRLPWGRLLLESAIVTRKGGGVCGGGGGGGGVEGFWKT